MSHVNAALTPDTGSSSLVSWSAMGGRSARSRPLPGFLAHRETVGRPLSRRRTHARPIVAAEVVAEQDQPVNDETVVSLRMRLREGPVQFAARLGIAPSTLHRILTSARLNRLSRVDRATGEPIRRNEHPHPGRSSTWT
jgi:hypothetical protein